MRQMVFTLFTLLAITAPALAESSYTCDRLANVNNYPAGRKFQTPIIAGQDGWLFQKGELALTPPFKAGTLQYLARLNRTLAAHSVQLVPLIIPKRPLLYPEKVAGPYDNAIALMRYNQRLALMRDAGLSMPDLLARLQQTPKDPSLFFARDYHWTTAAAAIAAELVAQTAKQQLSKLPSEKFTTTVEKSESYTGILAEVAASVCGINIPPEEKMRSSTKSAQNNGLLDKVEPRVVLAGTSFSATGKGDYHSGIANFAGALQQATQQDVLNVSVNGGGIDVALLSYLSSKSYQSNKPALIVWEIPAGSSSDIDDALFYRQAIPAAYGQCDENATIFSGSMAANKPLSIPAEKEIHGSSYFMQLALPQTLPSKINLRLGYADGKNEEVVLERNPRGPGNQNLFFELSDTYTASLVSIAASGVAGQIKTAICRK